MSKKWWLAFVLLFCSVLPRNVYAQEVLPSGVAITEIGEVVEAYIEEHEETTAAVSVAIFQNDETLYETHYGQTNIEEGHVANEESVYEWGSVSKLLVWVSVMQLWEQGELDLEADIQIYLPDNFLTKLNYEEPITMLHLMNHNAGFQDTVIQMLGRNEDEILPLEEALKVTEPEQIFRPGEVTGYSNWSTALAGFIVEEISGQPFSAYVHEYIFAPLGMTQTALAPDYSDNEWVKERLLQAQGYTSDLIPMNDGLFYINLYPAGSTAGTLADFQTFAQALLPNEGGDTRLFANVATLSEMFSPSLTYPGTDIDYINHGFWSHEYNVQALGHGGNTNMYSSYLLIDPESGLGMVVMTNQGGEMIYNYGFAELVFGEVGAMARTEERTDIRRMSDLYYGARTIRTGIASMYTISALQPYFYNNEGYLGAKLSDAISLSAEEIAPNTLILTQQFDDLRISNLARYSEQNGQKHFTSLYWELVEADTGVWLMTAIVPLFILALIWALGVLIVSAVKWVIQKLRRQPDIFDAFKKYDVMLNCAIILLALNIASVTNKMLSFEAPFSALRVNVIVSIILGIIPIIYMILLVRHWPKMTIPLRRKIGYVISLIMGLILTLTVIVLQMYRL